MKKINATRIEYNLSIINSKDDKQVKSNKYYIWYT